MLGLGSGRAELPELGVVRPHLGMEPLWALAATPMLPRATLA